MFKNWQVGDVIVDGVRHVAVYESRPGQTRIKTIALCGQVGAQDKNESRANATLLAQAPQMVDALRHASRALRELENRFAALETAYFTLRGTPAPQNPIGEVLRAQQAQKQISEILKAAGRDG